MGRLIHNSVVNRKKLTSAGVGELAGAVVLIIEGEAKNIKKPIALIESIKGDPPLEGFKGTCEKCRYVAYKFAGEKVKELPERLRD